MIFLSQKCLEQWNTGDFEAGFFTELRENLDALRLEAVCESGGTIKDDQVEYGDLKMDGEKRALVEGSFAFSFTEIIPKGCSDIERSDEQSGRIYFSLNLQNGSVTFGHSQHLDMTGE